MSKSKRIKCNKCEVIINSKDANECDFCISKSNKNKPLFYCSKCVISCYCCKDLVCVECIECACCDCCVKTCPDCSGDGEANCGCFGNCSKCQADINRGANGWPCSTCFNWYCDDCRVVDNNCKDCSSSNNETLLNDTNNTYNKCNKCDVRIIKKNTVKCESCTYKLNYDSKTGKKISINEVIPVLYCSKCAVNCFVCNEITCNDCIKNFCNDCGVKKCPDCVDEELPDCLCFGKCSKCNIDVKPELNGWYCKSSFCYDWYCNECHYFKITCEICNISGCKNCVKCVCGDCSAVMCTNCSNSGESKCKCYGNCTRCKKKISRGDSGWPCDECEEWLCYKCNKNYNYCSACSIPKKNNSSNSDSDSYSD